MESRRVPGEDPEPRTQDLIRLRSEAETLESALYRDGMLFLRFADGHSGSVKLADTGIDPSRYKLDTAQVSGWKSGLLIETKSGETEHVDAALLRAYCDPEYALALGRAIS